MKVFVVFVKFKKILLAEWVEYFITVKTLTPLIVKTQKDKTKPAYWACNLPRYAKSLGMSGGGNFFW